MRISVAGWAFSGAALLLLTSICFAQAGRAVQPPPQPELRLESHKVKIKDSTWLSSKRPRLLAELISKAPSATRTRLADSLSSPHSQGRSSRPLKGADQGKLDSDTNFSSKIQWSEISRGFSTYGLDIVFGTHYQTDVAGAAAKEIYDGVAQTSGVLTVDLNQLGPFTIVQAFTTTGDVLPDGQPEVFQKMVKVAGNKLRTQILEGQGYRIELAMPLNVVGDHFGSLILEEQTPVTLKLGGRVLSPKGVMTGAFETSKVILKTHAPIQVKANIYTNGPVEAGVQWKVVQNPGGLAITTPSTPLPQKGSTSLTFGFARGASTKSGSYPVSIEGTAFNGTTKLTLSATLVVQVYWVESNRNVFGHKWETCASSDGDYGFVFTPGNYINPQGGTHFLLALYGLKSSGGWGSTAISSGAIGARFTIQPAGSAQAKVGVDAGVAQRVPLIASASYVMSWGVQGSANASVLPGGSQAGTTSSFMVYVPSS